MGNMFLMRMLRVAWAMGGVPKGRQRQSALCVSLGRENIAVVDEEGRRFLGNLTGLGRWHDVAKAERICHPEPLAPLRQRVSLQEQYPLRDQPAPKQATLKQWCGHNRIPDPFPDGRDAVVVSHMHSLPSLTVSWAMSLSLPQHCTCWGSHARDRDQATARRAAVRPFCHDDGYWHLASSGNGMRQKAVMSEPTPSRNHPSMASGSRCYGFIPVRGIRRSSAQLEYEQRRETLRQSYAADALSPVLEAETRFCRDQG